MIRKIKTRKFLGKNETINHKLNISLENKDVKIF